VDTLNYKTRRLGV